MWYQRQRKYIKLAMIGVFIVLVFMFVTAIFGNKGKLLKDKNGQYYREIKQDNRMIHIPVFQDKKLNEEAKKYQKKILENDKIENLEYEIKVTGDLTQVIWTKKEDKKEEKETWIYHQNDHQRVTLKQVFHHWNREMEEKIITFLNLEWNRMIRTLTPPIPSDNQIQ